MNRVKVLYIEDEIFLGKIVKESLENRGYEIIMDIDGTNALELFHSCKPDICVFDIMLPGVEGYEIAKSIRAVDEKVPILFLTAKSQTEDVIKGFRSGGNDYIRKPFSMEELIVRLDNLLRTSRRTDEGKEVFQIGKYKFDTNRQLLLTSVAEYKLSHKECELLSALYTNKDKIINRRDILNLLWGNDNFFNSRNLDVYITRLRGYLKDDPSVQILTIKGIGYRFING